MRVSVGVRHVRTEERARARDTRERETDRGRDSRRFLSAANAEEDVWLLYIPSMHLVRFCNQRTNGVLFIL